MFNNGSLENGKYNDDSFETIIGPMVQVDGVLKSQGNVSIEGAFKGTLEVAHKLRVGKEAHIEADVTVGTGFIAGKVTGNIKAHERLELSETAHIEGDVESATIVMASGAILNGKCAMTGNRQYATPKTEESKKDEKKKDDNK